MSVWYLNPVPPETICLRISFPGVMWRRQCADWSEKWLHSHVLLPPLSKESCSARGGHGCGVVPSDGRRTSAVIPPAASEQLHQVTPSPPPQHCFPCRSPRRVWVLTVVLPSSHRPLSVSTEDYGKMWLSFSHDTKQNLRLVGGGQEALGTTLSLLERKLRLRVVEIIGEPSRSVINFGKQSRRTEAEQLP